MGMERAMGCSPRSSSERTRRRQAARRRRRRSRHPRQNFEHQAKPPLLSARLRTRTDTVNEAREVLTTALSAALKSTLIRPCAFGSIRANDKQTNMGGIRTSTRSLRAGVPWTGEKKNN